MRILRQPDDLTRQSLRRLTGSDDDFRRVLTWLDAGLKELDERNRITMDSALLRIQQGAAQALSDIVDVARDQGVKAMTPRPAVQSGPAGDW